MKYLSSSWCAESASKAYIDTVCAVKRGNFLECDAAELISAMAAGYGAKVIVETWARGSDVATSVGLAIARKHTGGRHVCFVPDQRSRSEYVDAVERGGAATQPELVVGEAEEAMGGLPEADFVVVDCQRKDFPEVLRLAEVSHRGAVVVLKSARAGPGAGAGQGFRWRCALGSRLRVVRSVYMPVGGGLEIAQVRSGAAAPLRPAGGRRWIRHVDRATGEEHVFRKL